MDYELYFDESNVHPGATCLYIGGLWIPRTDVQDVRRAIDALKRKRNIPHELKWDNVSRGFLPVYQALVDVFFYHAQARFHCSVLDKRIGQHKALYDTGIDRAIHAVYIHAAGQEMNAEHRYWFHVDRRNVGDKTLTLGQLQQDIHRRYHGSETTPIRHIEARDSKNEALIQLADVLLGALAYIPNNPASTGTAKYALCEYMAAQLGWPTLNREVPVEEEKITVALWSPETKKAP